MRYPHGCERTDDDDDKINICRERTEWMEQRAFLYHGSNGDGVLTRGIYVQPNALVRSGPPLVCVCVYEVGEASPHTQTSCIMHCA